ncbi:hypothetical protein KR222_006910, partial [Zaprionus bogoriensis]
MMPLLLLLLLAVDSGRTASVLHHSGGGGAAAISHQSFVQLSGRLATPTARIVNANRELSTEQLQLQLSDLHTADAHTRTHTHAHTHTPAHLTYAAHPVVHQQLPRIKPVRNLSYASLLPAPRS